MRRPIFTALLTCALLLGTAAGLQAQAIRGNSGFQVNSLPQGDDGPSSSAQSLGFTVNFFQRNFSTVYVNHNGNITFDREFGDFTPQPINNLPLPIIAPFWADVDTRGTGSVRWGRDTVDGRPAFAVTWDGVGYFASRTDKTNTFQVVLIDRSDTGQGNFDIEMNYARIQWESGEVDGGINGVCSGGECISASAGYSNGSTLQGTSFSIAGSLVPGAFLDNSQTALIRRTQNSNVPGRLIFQARGGQVQQLIISSLSPTSRTANSGDFDLTINGSGFVSGAQVVFGGSTLTPASITPTAVTVRIANSLIQTPGSVPVSVRQAGTQSNTLTFTVAQPAGPVLSSISPTSRTANSGDFTLTLTGSNFLSGATVLFGAASLTPTSVTPTQIVATVPNSLIQTPGTVQVRVRSGGIDTGSAAFTVVAPATPQISSLSPATREAGSGDFQLTITGSNFISAARVQFGGDATLTPSSVTATQIVVTVGNGLIQNTGDYWITVVQNQVQSNPARFTVTPRQIVVPPITLSGGGATVNPGASGNSVVTLGSALTVPVTGTLTLTFTPNATGLPSNYVDPALQFVAGGRTLTFTIPAGQTTATLPSNGAYNAGTVAGTITLAMTALSSGSTNLLPSPAPATTVSVARSAPVITPGTVRIVNTSNGFNVEVQGYSSPRDLTRANFTFSASASGRIEGESSFQVDVNSAFTTWFASSNGQSNGSRFLVTFPFTVTGGDASQVQSVTVTLTNSVGTSTAVSGGR